MKLRAILIFLFIFSTYLQAAVSEGQYKDVKCSKMQTIIGNVNKALPEELAFELTCREENKTIAFGTYTYETFAFANMKNKSNELCEDADFMYSEVIKLEFAAKLVSILRIST